MSPGLKLAKNVLSSRAVARLVSIQSDLAVGRYNLIKKLTVMFTRNQKQRAVDLLEEVVD